MRGDRRAQVVRLGVAVAPDLRRRLGHRGDRQRRRAEDALVGADPRDEGGPRARSWVSGPTKGTLAGSRSASGVRRAVTGRPAGCGRRRGSRSPPRAPRAGRGSRRPPPRAPSPRRRRCRASPRRPFASPSSLPSALPSRSRSASMSITSASGRQKVAPCTVSVTAPFGASAAASKRSTRASRATSARLRSSASACAGDMPSSTQRDLRPGRHVHLGADRADLLDQADHPAHLGVGGRDRPAPRRSRPVGVDEQRRARRGLPPERLGDERHERVQQDQALVERPGHRPRGSRRPRPASWNSGFASSTYQSQTLPQTWA